MIIKIGTNKNGTRAWVYSWINTETKEGMSFVLDRVQELMETPDIRKISINVLERED